MDSLFFHSDGGGVYMHQPFQAGNPRQDTNASFAKSLVRASCHRVYVCLCTSRSRYYRGSYSTLDRQDVYRYSRQSCPARFCLHDHRHALRSIVGKRGLGTLLGMGPKRDVGCDNLVCLPCLYPLPSVPSSFPSSRLVDACPCLYLASDVLVGHQLPVRGTGHQHPHL